MTDYEAKAREIAAEVGALFLPGTPETFSPITRGRPLLDGAIFNRVVPALRAAADEARREERERLDAKVAKAIDLLDRHLGDTDPAEEPDEYEDPVFWAMRSLVDIRARGEKDGGE